MNPPIKRRPLRHRVLSWMIRQSVPGLNLFRHPPPWPYSSAELSRFSSGTWGAELAGFLQARHLNLLTKYETHDAFHVLLGYDTNVVGEIRLQAFMLGNRSASFAGRILLLLGSVLMPELRPQLYRDFMRGRNSPRLAEWNVPDMLAHPLKTLTTRIAP